MPAAPSDGLRILVTSTHSALLALGAISVCGARLNAEDELRARIFGRHAPG